jgi:hypothetical protein
MTTRIFGIHAGVVQQYEHLSHPIGATVAEWLHLSLLSPSEWLNVIGEWSDYEPETYRPLFAEHNLPDHVPVHP